MSSVTGRASSIKQPNRGYIKLSDFDVLVENDGIELNVEENIHGIIIGLVVDYLTRFLMEGDVNDAFEIPFLGAMVADRMGVENSIETAMELMLNINGLDNTSIINACKLVTYDVWRRNPLGAINAKGPEETNPDDATIQNIKTLVKRSISFFEKYGPVIKNGFTFEPKKVNEKEYEKMKKTGKGSYGGYTPTVDSGDGDFLTRDTIWDFKVSKSNPTTKHTLQLIMYWIMGKHSGQDIFKNISKIGFFNPRINTIYLLDISKIPADTIKKIERDVICY